LVGNGHLNFYGERQALAHAEENLINTNDQDGMLPAASCSHPVDFLVDLIAGLFVRHLDSKTLPEMIEISEWFSVSRPYFLSLSEPNRQRLFSLLAQDVRMLSRKSEISELEQKLRDN
jgi:hypothetical protein